MQVSDEVKELFRHNTPSNQAAVEAEFPFGSQASLDAPEEKFAVIKMVLGACASSDLREYIGLGDDEFSKLMKNPLMSMAEEWYKNGHAKDIANWNYIASGEARNPTDIPEHVKETFNTGKYHGGELHESDYDEGHDGMTLEDFTSHPRSVMAYLKKHHVAVVRMYTSDSYQLFNWHLRAGTNPHPFRRNVYMLDEALKKMRKVEAIEDPERYNQRIDLFRGMADMEVDLEAFKKHGGNELALMSTSSSKETALAYASTGKVSGLIFRLSTIGHSRGIQIDHLSLYPKECEYLFPPLTNLTFDQTSEVLVENGVEVVPIVPMWS